MKARAVDDLPTPTDLPAPESHASLLEHQHAFGYTTEILNMLMIPMARDGVEALGSMGDDAPVAVLSDQPQLLYSYFRQLFAQVTNPPLDAIREELITASDMMLGNEGNLLETIAENCRQIHIKNPILTNEQLSKLTHIQAHGLKARKLSMLFPVKEGWQGLEKALVDLFAQADNGVLRSVPRQPCDEPHDVRWSPASVRARVGGRGERSRP